MAEIKFTKKQISQLRKIDIGVIYLFGSRAKGKIHPFSDFDIGIVFNEPEKYKDKTLDIYLRLYDIFIDVLPKDYLKRRFEMREYEFDLVFLQFAPINLQFNAIKDGEVLYEKNKEAKFRYQEDVMKRIADFQYFNNMRYKTISERLAKI